MPNKKESFFADFLKKLEADTIADSKPVEQIEEKRYFLIVCEGVKTEPIYFNYLKRFLQNHLLETIEINGQGLNTISVVNAAIKIRDKRTNDGILPPFDEVWAVFDKDDFPDDNFDNAVAKALEHNIEPGISNEAFELWYVLHFQFLQTALKRDQYIEILSSILGFKYEKNKQVSERVIKFLFERGDIRNAFNWAERLEELHRGKKYSQYCPYTRVHVLVKRILDYAKYKY